jgi:hypothetical protein
MTTNMHGQTPGKDTPKKIVTGGYKTTTVTTKVTAIIIAIWTALKGAASGFFLDRGIGLDSLALLILAAILLIQGVMQWMH